MNKYSKVYKNNLPYIIMIIHFFDQYNIVCKIVYFFEIDNNLSLL